MLKPFYMCKSQRTGCSNSLCFIFLLVLLSTLVFSISSCKQLFEGENDKESASIALQLPSTKRSLGDTAQNYAEITKHYEVSFIRSGISDITVKGLPGETVTSGEILEGSYDVEVYAYSEENKKIGYGKKTDVRVIDGETTYITIGISEIKEPAVTEDLPENTIGTKLKPTAVGDIVFSDGTATPYSTDLVLTEVQKSEAIAVIFYAGTSGDTLGARTLGVGLKNTRSESPQTLEWTTNSSFTKVTAILTSSNSTGASTAKTTTFSGDTNGSDNWAALEAALSDTGISGKYPAFEWVNAYASRNSITGKYASGWYIPTLAELCILYRALESSSTSYINSLISTTLDGDSIPLTVTYWTSSMNTIPKVYFVQFDNAAISYTDSTNQVHTVCAIHEF